MERLLSTGQRPGTECMRMRIFEVKKCAHGAPTEGTISGTTAVQAAYLLTLYLRQEERSDSARRDAVPLVDLLRRRFAVESMTAGNVVQCSGACSTPAPAGSYGTVHPRLLNAPAFLLLHLVRHAWSADAGHPKGGAAERLHQRVDLPLELDMGEYTSSWRTVAGGVRVNPRNLLLSGANYALVAFVVHSGARDETDANNGHIVTWHVKHTAKRAPWAVCSNGLTTGSYMALDAVADRERWYMALYKKK